MTAPAKSPPQTYNQFFTDVLTKLGIKPTTGDLAGLAGVVNTEGKNSYYNPFNIEWHPGSNTAWQGIGNWNSVGVQEYGSYAQGVNATAAFLQDNSGWSGVLGALRQGSKSGVDSALTNVYTWAPFHPVQSTNPYGNGIGQNIMGTNSTVAGGPVVNGSIVDQVAEGTLNAESAAAKVPNEVAGAIEGVLKDIAGPIVRFLINAGLVIVGVVLAIVALVMLAKSDDHDNPPPAAASGSESHETDAGGSEGAAEAAAA